MRSSILCLFWLLLSVICLQSQGLNYDFRVYGFEEGLTHRNIFKIDQDAKGFLWIATINGLNRFDGERFLHFSTLEDHRKVPVNYIHTFHKASDGTFWVSGPNTLFRFDPVTHRTELGILDSTSSLNGKQCMIADITIDDKGGLWCTNYAGRTGECVVQRKTADHVLQDMFTLKSTFSRAPVIFWNGNLLMGSDKGEVWVLNFVEKRLETKKIGKEHSQVVDFEAAQDGSLLILLQDGGVYRLEAGAKAFTLVYRLPDGHREYSKLFFESASKLWIGGYASLWEIDLRGKNAVDHHDRLRDLTKNTCTVRDIFKDRTGVIWVATDFGLVKISIQKSLFEQYLSDGNDHCANGFCSMRGMAEDDDSRVYFSYYSAIHVLDPKTNILQPLFPKKNFFNPPFGLLYHRNYLVTGNGTLIHLPTLKTDTIFGGSKRDAGVVIASKDGSLWFGYGNQLLRYDWNSRKKEPFVDKTGAFHRIENDISYLLEPKDGRSLWVATNNNGAFQIDKMKGTIRHLQANTGLKHARVLAIQEDSKGEIWLATAAGIHLFSPSAGTMKVMTSAQGLPNDFINGILFEGDTVLWASTDNGLSRIHLASGRVQNFFQQDGLSANEFNRISFLKASNGRLYFGGLNGVNAFFPRAAATFEKPSFQAPLLLTGFSKYNGLTDEIEESDHPDSLLHGVTLSHRDRFFEFSFALADYTRATGNQYSYLLENFDKDWSAPTTLNFVRYNNIPPGRYVFRLRAAAFGSGFQPSELVIPIHIRQAYYKSWWFLGFMIMVVLGLIYAIAAYREYNLRQREQQLEVEVKERTHELEVEKQKSEDLLLNILPAETAVELKLYGKAKARRHNLVTVLFSDFVNFSKIAGEMEPETLVSEIDFCFRHFDQVIEKYGLEKIKTIGDAYMCAGGINAENPAKSARDVVAAGLEIQDFMKNTTAEKQRAGFPYFEARIGVHSGPVVAGIVGIKKFAYDIWGDTVNIASRMESQGKSGTVNISEKTFGLVKDFFLAEPHGTFVTKNELPVKMYFVKGLRLRK